jgi:SAM-dependent methyltransferase
MQKDIENWYASWFNTPFYHILYKDRNEKEARFFMDGLTTFLNLPLGSEILDLACGKGRHARYLNELGFDVTGVDLSPESIAYAKRFENRTLHFEEHDMCLPYPKKFDAVFNLFTSFGYFDSEEDNLRTIRSIREELKPTGYGVIDFMNVETVKKNMVPEELKCIDGIKFKIEKYIEHGHIIKNISFDHRGKEYFFTERVKALELEDFKNYFQEANVTIRHLFGDYELNPFHKEVSERLILIFSL